MKKIYILFAFAFLAFSANAQINVTFKADMNLQTVDPTGVFLAGSFQGWNATATPMTDADMDGIYEVTLAISEPVGTVIQFKFLNGASWESVPSTCDMGGNRHLTLAAGGNTHESCFSSCDASCPTTVISVDVTFQVNMKNMIIQNGMPNGGVHLAGGLQGWDPAGTTLTDMDGDSIYTVTLTDVAGNTFHEYKYLFGDAWGYDESVSDTTCNSGNNRGLTLGDADTTLPVVCFGICSDCPTLGAPSQVVLGVDMSNEIHNPDSIYVVGTLQFPANETKVLKMEDPDGDLLYKINLSLYDGTYQYRFHSEGATNAEENGAGNPYAFDANGCGVATQFGDRRLLTVAGADMYVAHEWNTCSTIDITNVDNVAASMVNFKAQPNPFTNSTLITFDNPQAKNYTLTLINVMGQVVHQINNINSNQVELSRGNLAKGMYFAMLMDENGQRYTQKLIVE